MREASTSHTLSSQELLDPLADTRSAVRVITPGAENVEPTSGVASEAVVGCNRFGDLVNANVII